MPERSTVAQGVQIGVEATAGTAVPANRRLQSLGISIRPDMEFDEFEPSGNKFATLVLLDKEWTAADLEGRLTYTEIVYVLSSLMGTATITTPDTATNARQWEFTISATSADTPKTLTVESGDGSLAERVAGLLINALTLGISRDSGVSLSGEGFGRLFTAGATLTASPTSIALVPAMPKDFSVYVDAPPAAPYDDADVEDTLGTTKLTRVSAVEVELGDRYSQFWAVDSAQTSFATTVEGRPATTLTLTVMADSVGMGFLATAREGATRFVRIEGISNVEVEAGIPYSITIDMAVKINDVGDRDDSDNAQVIPYGMRFVYDPDWDASVRVRVVNGLTAL